MYDECSEIEHQWAPELRRKKLGFKVKKVAMYSLPVLGLVSDDFVFFSYDKR